MVEVARRPGFTRAQEDYLKAFYHLHGDLRPVPTRDLAQRLGISSPSVSEMVTRLAAQGLVEHDRYKGQAAAPARAARSLPRGTGAPPPPT